MKPQRLLVFLVLAVALGVLVSACGGGPDSTGSSSVPAETSETPSTEETPSAEETASAEGEGNELVKGPSETPPTEIMKLPQLKEPPPTGIKAIQLQCDFAACDPFAKSFKEAAKTLGWDLKTIVFKTGQPESAMTTAVNTPGIEYIAVSGVSRSLIEPQVKTAEEKGIKIISCCDSDPAEGPSGVWPVQISEPQHGNMVNLATEVAHWMINDSEGKAKAAIVGYPENPSTAPGPETFEKVFAEACPGCSAEEIPVTGEELAAGTTAGKVVAFLQSHPDIDYLHFIFGGVMTGAPEAIKAAGLEDKVKLSGQSAIEGEGIKLMEEGRLAAWYVGGQAEWGYLWADAIIRLAEGMPLPQKEYANSPRTWLCTPKSAEECVIWEGPEDFRGQFEELWGSKK